MSEGITYVDRDGYEHYRSHYGSVQSRAWCSKCRLMFSGVSTYEYHIRRGKHRNPVLIPRLTRREDGVWAHKDSPKKRMRPGAIDKKAAPASPKGQDTTPKKGKASTAFMHVKGIKE